MPLRLYNTRTRALEAFAPLIGEAVRIYVCGLTPSAEAHIGHARSFLFFDVLRRYLEYSGYDVTYVQNVTDIDDRSIARAKETGENWYDIVSGYYASFKVAMERLGVREPDEEPYATKYIAPIITMIEELIAKGHAYAAKDGVYFSVPSFARYGALSNRNTDELQSGARIEIDEFKHDPLDFALWKFVKPGEPFWPAPWGDGRPGWHIECSAMARELLDPAGLGFDIHGGGADLIFPHHENEIAQSEPLMAHPPMANVWMHGGLLLFENKKMSKSIGNFEPLGELLDRHDPQAIRLLFLQTGYSKVMNFTEDSIAAAAQSLDRLKAAYRQLQNAPRRESGDAAALQAAVREALDNDINTAGALAELHKLAGRAAELERTGTDVVGAYEELLDVIGLGPNAAWATIPEPELTDAIREKLRGHFGDADLPAIMAARVLARAEKNWAESDRVRDVLLACGIAIKDSKDGTTWTVAG
ncbi:MAG: cysteine--tRNA ligase [Candidatus Eremiobacteraeota bacterium]|nr:cysteine--tRNA ligase [Candidatus Eremiobacteraeota bacterium]